MAKYDQNKQFNEEMTSYEINEKTFFKLTTGQITPIKKTSDKDLGKTNITTIMDINISNKTIEELDDNKHNKEILRESPQLKNSENNNLNILGPSNNKSNVTTKFNTRYNSYDRGLTNSKAKKSQSISLSISGGEMMYRKSMINEEKKKKEILESKRRLEEDSLANCSFQPQIDSNSRALCMKTQFFKNKVSNSTFPKSFSALNSPKLSFSVTKPFSNKVYYDDKKGIEFYPKNTYCKEINVNFKLLDLNSFIESRQEK